MALAAATAGETRCVLTPRPWRPSKLRLLVAAARWPGRSRSSLSATHIEHPESRNGTPGGGEYGIETFLDRLGSYGLRPGNQQYLDTVGDLAAAPDVGDLAEVLDSAVGARSDEHGVDLYVAHAGAGAQIHVAQRALGSGALHRVEERLRVWDNVIE